MIDRDTIVRAFGLLSDRLEEHGVTGEIDVVGGTAVGATAMMLAFQARQTTRDVDAVFIPAGLIRDCAAQVAVELDLPPDWLNDAAKGYLSDRGEFEPKLTFPYLRVMTPSADYLLAMKVMAARSGLDGGPRDKDDIAFLVRRIGLDSSEAVMSLVERFYDRAMILPRSVSLVEEVIEELRKS